MTTFRTSIVLAAGLLACLPVAARADDTAKLVELFAPAMERGGTVTIPPGDYRLDGASAIVLPSATTVLAYGARFQLPERLGDQVRVVVFAGENVRDFRWFGGHFSGHVFDPARPENSWEPNANTRALLVTTTPGGCTENLTFRDLTADGLAAPSSRCSARRRRAATARWRHWRGMSR